MPGSETQVENHLDRTQDRLDRLGLERVAHPVDQLESTGLARRAGERLGIGCGDERIGPPVHGDKLHLQGLSFVHQDLGLVSDLTVRENVRVGRHATRTFARWINKGGDRQACLETFAFLGVDIDPGVPVSALPPSQRAAVAVARALQDREVGHGVIVFDESSRAIRTPR